MTRYILVVILLITSSACGRYPTVSVGIEEPKSSQQSRRGHRWSRRGHRAPEQTDDTLMPKTGADVVEAPSDTLLNDTTGVNNDTINLQVNEIGEVNLDVIEKLNNTNRVGCCGSDVIVRVN